MQSILGNVLQILTNQDIIGSLALTSLKRVNGDGPTLGGMFVYYSCGLSTETIEYSCPSVLKWGLYLKFRT